ncbi:MAG: hypothetical protein KGH75_03730 [Rhodospirillales bacterium]|nr:hypothetical protein [Rhodospirillales bacterium]
MPIPTAWAWVLLESVLGPAPLQILARVAAIGAAARLGKSEATAFETTRQFLRRVSKSGKARPSTIAAIEADIEAGGRHLLSQAYPPEKADELFGRLSQTQGPFAVLAALIDIPETTPAYRRLMAFSQEMDRLGTALQDAAARNDFAHARDLLLQAKMLDNDYWSLPGELPDAAANREKLRGANDWDQLIRAAAPIILNVPLSWLSLLDIAIAPASAGRNRPLFQELITKPAEPSPSDTPAEADRQRVPVSNLVQMIEEIASGINAKLQQRKRPPERRIVNAGDQAYLRDQLDVPKKHDLLSADQFADLLHRLRPDAEPKGDERCGFDPWALLLATNLFSLFTPRDGARPDGKARRDGHEQITSFPVIEAGYLRLWQMNQNKLAGSAVKRPRPS